MMKKNIDAQVLQNYAGDFANTVISNLGDETKMVRGKDILNLTPSKQVNFFILKILYSQWQDEMKKLESPYFNYRNEEVRKALNTFMNVLSQHIEVRVDDMKPILSKAVELTINWLFFPSEGLKNEVIEREIKSMEGIKNLTRYYKIYQEDLSYLIKEKEGAEVSKFLEEWDQLMEQKSVSSTVEKELGSLSQVLPISKSDLFEEEDVDTGSETEDQENDHGDLDSATDEISEQAMEHVEKEDENKSLDIEEGTAKSEESNTLIDEEESEDDQPEPDDSINQQFAKSQETLHDQYKEDQVSVAAKHQQKKISSILEAVSVNQEYMFTQELFGGEKEKFLEAVEKIEGCNSFDESVEVLVSNYSQEYSWNMNSAEVKDLLKVVFRRFR